MKKFIRNLLVAFILVLIFNTVVFVFANDNYYKGYTEFPDKKFNTFIIADSHGFALDKFSEKYGVYNFSSSSDSYLDMKRKIIYLIENNYKIDRIYLTADGHTLSPYRDQYDNRDKSIVYTSEVNYHYIKEKYLKYYFPIFQVKVIPLLKIYLENKLLLIFPHENEVANPRWDQMSENEKKEQARARLSGQYGYSSKSKNLEKILLEIIQLCKKNKIEVVGLKFPLSDTYSKMVAGHDFGADRLFLANGCGVIDCEFLFKNDDRYFGDQDHLNSEGAKKFLQVVLK